MNIIKRATPQLIMLLVICLIAAFSYVKTEIIGVSASPDSTRTVIIDAGHGGLTNTID